MDTSASAKKDHTHALNSQYVKLKNKMFSKYLKLTVTYHLLDILTLIQAALFRVPTHFYLIIIKTFA